CYRLREKEEFKKLLQLQSQRSPWQQPVSFTVPRPSSNVNDSDIISISSSESFVKSIQTKSLLDTLYERRQRYNMDTLVRKSAVHYDQNFLTNRLKDHSHKPQANTEVKVCPSSQQSDAVLIIDDDHDDSQPTAAKSASATDRAAVTK
ncbi:unnamed protein product, partial [Candidula unifasciata]